METYQREFPTAIEARAFLEGIEASDSGDLVAHIARSNHRVVCVEDYKQDGGDDPFYPSDILLPSEEREQERVTDEHRSLEIGRLVIEEVNQWGDDPVNGDDVVDWLGALVRR
ncbi:MAG: hypothetical protein ACE10K_14310 [Rhodothermales bacterium]